MKIINQIKGWFKDNFYDISSWLIWIVLTPVILFASSLFFAANEVILQTDFSHSAIWPVYMFPEVYRFALFLITGFAGIILFFAGGGMALILALIPLLVVMCQIRDFVEWARIEHGQDWPAMPLLS